MGKRKIEVKRLEPASHRNSTFGKRFKGLSKKAEELSVLCDVPILLFVTKPTGVQKLCLTGKRTFEQIVQQFVNESKESRNKEKSAYCIELRKRDYKDDHVVDVRSPMHDGVHQAEGDETFEKKKQLEKIEEEIAKMEDHLGPLRCTDQIEKINRIDQLVATEISLQKLFSLHEAKKALLLEQQKNGHHHLPTSFEGDLQVSTSPLVQQTDGLSEALLIEQQTTCPYIPLHNEMEVAQAANLEAPPSSSQQSDGIDDLLWLRNSIDEFLIDPDWPAIMDEPPVPLDID